MPMDIIPKELYPVVPFAPGIPAVLRSGATVLDTLTLGQLGLSDALGDFLGPSNASRWGVFTPDGAPVAVADSIISVDYKNSSRVSDFPVEAGAFASYNKVANPYTARVRMTRGGTRGQRGEFKAALDAAEGSLNLYTILMPDMSYSNATIESVDWRHETDNGAGMVIAELQLREVRQVAVRSSVTPKSPSAATPQANGQVQPAPVSTAAASAIKSTPVVK